MSFLGILAVAAGALWGKKSRNLLTISGVAIGVFALTTIVALGQGLSAMIAESIANDSNLRQIRLLGGAGIPQSHDSDDVEISGEMSDARRLRLRRAALNRRRMRRSAGRRLTVITDGAMSELAKIDHVKTVQPLVMERYRLKVGDHSSDAAVSFGVDVDRNLYDSRLMDGRYFSSNDADEVILHEYLLYQWGYSHPEEQEQLIGETLTLTTIQNPNATAIPKGMHPALAELGGELTKEEQDALKTLLPKLMQRFAGEAPSRSVTEREFKVVGIFREAEPGEPFNFVEDTISAQADVYLPHNTAQELFLSSSINSELGYGSALVIVDDPKHVEEVEQSLRDRGYTAFSV
ncbi:MAG: ABC transporter permease, partial [Bythopirellula sp.]